MSRLQIQQYFFDNGDREYVAISVAIGIKQLQPSRIKRMIEDVRHESTLCKMLTHHNIPFDVMPVAVDNFQDTIIQEAELKDTIECKMPDSELKLKPVGMCPEKEPELPQGATCERDRSWDLVAAYELNHVNDEFNHFNDDMQKHMPKPMSAMVPISGWTVGKDPSSEKQTDEEWIAEMIKSVQKMC